jgi:hypothetical protein
MAATGAGFGAKVAVATGPATFGFRQDHPQFKPDHVMRSIAKPPALLDRLKYGDSL